MGKQKEKEKKQKPLDKMTAKELRELALTLEGIVGVHAMNKNELVDAVKKAKGIVEEKTKKSDVDVRALKLKIKELPRRKNRPKRRAIQNGWTTCAGRSATSRKEPVEPPSVWSGSAPAAWQLLVPRSLGTSMPGAWLGDRDL